MKVLLLIAAGCVFVGVGALAFVTTASRTLHVRPALASGNTATAQYAAGLGQAGFSLDVAGTDRSSGQLRVNVVFRNTSHAQQRADLADFSLIDGSGATLRPLSGTAGCPAWPKTDLHVAANDGQAPRDPEAQQVGPSYGPVPLCFSASAGPARLVWDPDVSIGFLSSPVQIAIP